MKSQTLPFPAIAPPRTRASRFGFIGLLLSAALVLWYGIIGTFLVPNRFMLALWFVLAHLLLPMTACSVGWLAHACVSRSIHDSLWKQVCTHFGLLVFACAALPVVLGVINRLPIGQTTDLWRGKIKSWELHQNPWNKSGVSTAIVTSDTLGPGLRFRIMADEHFALNDAAARGELPEVTGSVVRGFLGVPIGVQMDHISNGARTARARRVELPSR